MLVLDNVDGEFVQRLGIEKNTDSYKKKTTALFQYLLRLIPKQHTDEVKAIY